MRKHPHYILIMIAKKCISLALIGVIIIVGTFGLSPVKAEAAFSSPTPRGSNSTTAGNNSSISVSPDANITVGKLAVVAVVTNNTDTADTCSGTTITLSDTDGHTWDKAGECTETDGSAADGVTISLFSTVVVAQIDTSDSITASFTSNVADSLIMVFEATLNEGSVTLEQFGQGPASDDATVTGMTGSTEYLLVGLYGGEGEDSTKSPDADYAEIFDIITGTGGQPHTNIESEVQTRIVTLTGDTVSVADNSALTKFSSLAAFRETSISVPTVTTDSATSITDTTATPNGNMTATGGQDASVRGFAWGTDSALSNGDTATTTENGIFGTGTFSTALTSLTPGTQYYFRAYTTNAAGSGYGSIDNFTTTTVVVVGVGQPRVLRFGTLILLFGTLIIF